MTTRITTSNIETATLAQLGGPKITNIEVTDSSYTVLDDTAVDVAGGYIRITGTGFESGCQVVVDNTPAASVTYISSTQVRAQLPATAAGTYIVYLVNPTGGVAIRVNGITFSGTPTWVSGSALAGAADMAISIQLTATDATTFALAAGSALPPGVTLSSGGLLSGTITGITQETVYNFTINAVDAELQDSPKSFAFTVTAGDQYFNLTTLLLPGSATTFVKDASTNNFAVTVAGDTRPNTFNPYLTGWSNYFDGTGDALSLPIQTPLILNTATYTIECWINVANTSAGARAIYSFGTASAANYGYFIFGQSGSTLVFYIRPTTGGAETGFTAGTLLPNQWIHVAVSVLNTQAQIFVNGTKVGSTTTMPTLSFTTAAINVGSEAIQGYNFNGYISNLRVVKGTALYTTNFTPSAEPLTAIANTSLLTCQSNRFIDNSVNNFAVTRTGDVKVQSFSPFQEPATVNGSGYFDGTGDYLTVASNAAFSFGTADFTVECWAYFTSLASNTVLFDRWTAGDLTGWQLYYRSSGTSMTWYDNGVVQLQDPTASRLTVNQWYHIAVSRSGTTLRMFINGVLVASATNSTSLTNSNALGIGSQITTNTNPLTGYISNARIVKGTALYTTAFTPPTEPLTAVSGTSLLTLQNNQPANNSQFLDSSGNNFVITRAGNATQGTLSPYSPAGWSNYFDGTGDSLTSNLSQSINFGTGDFTVECWVNFSNADSTPFYIIDGRNASDTSVWRFYRSETSALTWHTGSVLYQVTSFTSKGVWTHVAWTRSGTSLRAFVNGVLTNTFTDSTDYTATPTTSTIGSRYSAVEYLNGYISNLRIVKGTAVYTADFTPSTQPLTAIAGTSLLTCQSSGFVDNSTNRLAVTRAGDARVTNFAPFDAVTQTPVTYSAYFDGTGDYLTVPSNAAITPGTGDFTVEFWFNNSHTTWARTMDFVDGASGGLAIYVDSGTTTFRIAPQAGSSTSLGILNTTIAPLNQWNHFAVIRSSGSIRAYVNGSPLQAAVSYTTSLGSLTKIGGTVDGYIIGHLSNIRYVSSAVYDISQSSIAVPTTPLTAIANTSLLTCQSPTFVDNSTNNFAITAVGNSQPTTVNPFGFTFTNSTGYSASEYSGSMYFDGSGDHLKAASNVSNFGTGDFTIQAWVYRTGTTSVVVSNQDGGSDNNYFTFDVNNTESIFQIRDSASQAYAYGSAVNNNAWSHVAVTRLSGTVRLFVNGVSGTPVTITKSITARLTIVGGFLYSTYESYFAGYISNLQVIKGTALYTSNFVPPAAPVEPVANTVLLLNGTAAAITDATTRNVLETVGDARISTAVSKFGGSSIYFDGSGDRLIVPSSPNFDFTGDFTIEMWINFANVTSTWEAIISRAYALTGGWRLYKNDGNNQLIWYSNVTSVVSTSGSTLANNTWSHIAVVRNSGTLTIYIDGVNRGSAANTTSYTPGNYALEIGEGVVSSAYPFEGYIQDLRITKHARYTANFTPPAAAFQPR